MCSFIQTRGLCKVNATCATKCVHKYLFNLFKQNGLTTVSLKRLKTVIYIKKLYNNTSKFL